MAAEELHIGDRIVGPGRPTLVVAEIGVNHDGSVQRAVELACAAAACGADAVKLQLFRATRLVHPSATMALYQRQRVRAADPLEMLRRYELEEDEVAEVVEAVRGLGLIPLATPFSIEDVDLVERLDLPAVKIASPDLVNRPLLARAARLGKPLLVSTGAATMEEVQQAMEWLREWNASVALMHCVSSYPVTPEQANLCWISELAERFGVPVGYSDHTTVLSAGSVAVGFGAAAVEKHLTYDRKAEGPDHAASADPQQFAQYVKLVREADALRGVPGKHVLRAETDVRTVSRQSLVAVRDLLPGDELCESDLAVQRPGTGVPAAAMDELLGRRVARAVPAGSILQWGMFAEAVSDAA